MLEWEKLKGREMSKHSRVSAHRDQPRRAPSSVIPKQVAKVKQLSASVRTAGKHLSAFSTTTTLKRLCSKQLLCPSYLEVN